MPVDGSYDSDANEKVTSLPWLQFPHLRNALGGALELDNEALSLPDILCPTINVLRSWGEPSACAIAHKGPREGLLTQPPPSHRVLCLGGAPQPLFPSPYRAADSSPGAPDWALWEPCYLMRAPRWSLRPLSWVGFEVWTPSCPAYVDILISALGDSCASESR